MENYFTAIKLLLTTIGAYVSAKLGILAPLILLLLIEMIADYVSALLAAKVEKLNNPNNPKFGWSSKKGALGIFKKLGYGLAVVVGMSIDYLIVVLTKELGITIGVDTFFGLLTTIWLILNELLSITENLYRADVRLPSFLQSIVLILKNNVETKINLENTENRGE